MAVGVFEKRAAQWASRRGWKRLSESVFPVVATALAQCFVDSCSATDTHLGSGFGDTLSSKAAGHDELADLVEILVCAHLSGRAQELAIDLQSAMSPDQTDFSGVDCVTFLTELADCLTRNVREAAAKSGPLTQWYVIAQNDTTLSQMRDSVALLEEVTAAVHDLQRAVPGAALPPRLVRLPLTNVRGRSEFEFVGREKQFEEILKQLSSFKLYSVGARLDGIGGVGKSTLALEVAWHFIERYDTLPADDRFDVVVWSSAKQYSMTASGQRRRHQELTTLGDLLRDILVTFGRDDLLRYSVDDQRRIVQQLLREDSRRTLLVVDNLETIDDHSIFEWLSEVPPPTKILATTREVIELARKVELAPMTFEESRRLQANVLAVTLQRLGSQPDSRRLTDEDMELLHRRCGGVPLALELTVARIGEGQTIDSALEELSGVGDVVGFSIGASVDKTVGRRSGSVLEALALFDQPVSRRLLTAAAGLQADTSTFDDALRDLNRLSLVVTVDGCVDIQPLTRIYLRDRLKSDADRRAVRTAVWEAAISEFGDAYRRPEWEWRDLNRLRTDGVHLQPLFDIAQDDGRVDLCLRIAPALLEYLDVTGDWARLIELAQTVTSFATATSDGAVLLIAAELLSGIASQQGRAAESEAALQQAERWATDAGSRQSLLQSWAQHFRFAGDYERARDLTNEARQVIDSSDSPDCDLWRASNDFEIAKRLRDQGDWLGAEKMLRSAARILTEERANQIVDGTSSGSKFNVERTWGLLGNLGLVELRLGRPEAALPILERATEYFREHGRIGNLVSNLLRVSEALVLVGRSDDAELPLTEAALWAGRLGLVRDLAEVVRIRELVPVDEQSIC